LGRPQVISTDAVESEKAQESTKDRRMHHRYRKL
jgi:hypothetical protein